MSRRPITSYFYERKCYLCEQRTVCPEYPPPPKRTPQRVRFTFAEPKKMLRSASPHYPSRGGSDIRVIRLTVDQEAVLQEQFNRWPRAPHTADVVLLAAETGLSEADVEAWYAIRLAQWRKEQGLGGNLGLH
ncbi:homeodomain-only protein isoform X1 [Megalopta genalis]|uniref:homeodomain-only protein isoform X1 n=1 Tax=Megalopta genalis TaxID=115081 RepID=UPI0014438577|nr:homeodomain-only protein-like isoform X1 [Megalopta genalis]